MTESSQPLKLIIDDQPFPFVKGDSVLVAMLRNQHHPTGGGCLCLGGDCPHCLATVDGVAYVRTCQVPARPGCVVACTHRAHAVPALPQTHHVEPPTNARHQHADVVVIGQGESGLAAAELARTAGQTVVTLDAAQGQEVIGIYPGAQVVARTTQGMLTIHVRQEIIVATGAAELHPVAPGNTLAGLMTARAAQQLQAAGLSLGRIVVINDANRLVRFEGESNVTAVVVRDDQGLEQHVGCDTVVIDLGTTPRNMLYRMAAGLPGVRVSVVGDAATNSDVPNCPAHGLVCHCSQVGVADLQSVWDRGFHELELVKRASLAGTGTCQGGVCLPYVRGFLANKGGTLQPAFTARPLARPITMGEVAAGGHHHVTLRTPLDGVHRAAHAHMERAGGWWRPWNYGDWQAEYWAVREAVSIMDVSTLGKMLISGPDALTLLDRLYPTKVSTIKTGMSRYVLLLDEKGYVLDDGLISKISDTRYTLTFTSGGATTAELWVRDWAESWGLNVRILNQTMSLGAINVTGPLAKELLARAGLEKPPEFLSHVEAHVAGIPCRIFRLSFTGELSYELHHGAVNAPILWRSLLDLGKSLNIRPHGLEALLKLRLEKGHIIVGQDTDFDSTPRRIHHEWAVKLDKPDFVGKHAVLRTNKVSPDKILCGLSMEGPPPIEGANLTVDGNYAGYVTSATWSPILGKTVMLAWLKLSNDMAPDRVMIDGRPAQRTETPFYDKEGARAKA